MTRTEYRTNYKLSRKLSLLDLTWVVSVLATFFGAIAVERAGWLDSWFIVIPLCFAYMLLFSIIGNWYSTKKNKKFNLVCPTCQYDLSHLVGITIATGKCQKCKRELFDPDKMLDMPPYMSKTKMELAEWRKKISRYLWMLLIFWIVSALAILFVTRFFEHTEIGIVAGLIVVLIIGGLYLTAFLIHLHAHKQQFVCPVCKIVICNARIDIALKTDNCSQCGKRLFGN